MHTANVAKWYHIRSAENPAEFVSRGLTPIEINSCEMWWHGPPWLREPMEKWNLTNNKSNITAECQTQMIKEEIIQASPVASARVDDYEVLSIKRLGVDENVLERHQDLKKSLMITAYVFRAIKNLKARNNCLPFETGVVTSENMEEALMYWAKREQRKYYQREINEIHSFVVDCCHCQLHEIYNLSFSLVFGKQYTPFANIIQNNFHTVKIKLTNNIQGVLI